MSPLQNRVTPLGAIIADPARGLVFGNRGCLHNASGEIRRRYAMRAWITCRLEFKDRRRPLLQPGRYTELFFLDDATALAAGHRPCAECRREDFNTFRDAFGVARAPEIDRLLHAERLGDRVQSDAPLPTGAFVLHGGEPWLVHGDVLRHWTPAGYDRAVPRPAGPLTVITPPSTVAVLAQSWVPTAVPLLHPSTQLG